MPRDTPKPPREKHRCGLCGKTRNLTKTECCGNWICDDEGKYAMSSYTHSSCRRNHAHHTLCASHHAEGHPGSWKDCKKCRESTETEMYVWYGTNEYNFEKLANPPAYEPTQCAQCGRVIRLAIETHSFGHDGYVCAKCTEKGLGK